MKTLKLILISVALLTGFHCAAQLEFTRQSQVDSFVANISQTHIRTFVFRYDIGVPANDQITDLSGFDVLTGVVATFVNFEWEDLPWFKNLYGSSISFINMPLLSSISGPDSMAEHDFYFEDCPSFKEFSQKTIPGLKQIDALKIVGTAMDSLHIDLTGMSKSSYNSLSTQRIDIKNTRIKHVTIWDPDLIASKFDIRNDSAMQYLYIDGKKAGGRGGYIIGNSELEYLRGFKTCTDCWSDIYDNPKLKDLCVLRDGLVKFYDGLSPKNIGLFRVYNNGPGASSIEDLRAADCSWLADTFTTVYESNTTSGGLKLYPNPSRGSFNILPPSGKQIQQVSVYTLQGVEVPVEFVAGPHSAVVMEEAVRGMYVLKVVYADGESTTVRMIKNE